MTDLQRLELRAAEIRGRLATIGGEAELTDEFRSELSTLRTEYIDNESRQSALKIAGDGVVEKTVPATGDAETRAFKELTDQVEVRGYVRAAVAGHGVTGGAEAELLQHLGMDSDKFPMMLLARGLETRASRDGDAEASQGTWLDRVMDGTAAMQLGITMRNVAPGVATYPVTSAGGSGVQRGREQAVGESTYTVAVHELKPTRNAVHGIFSREDSLRLPGLEDALVRDMRGGIMESVDKAIFVGDAGADENVADIAGLTSATGVVESTLTQAAKVMGPSTLAIFAGLIDGAYAMSPSDLRVVVAEGANTLWMSTIVNSAASNDTLAQFLRNNGIMYTVRGGIETNTANDDYGAFIGLARGLEGSAIAAVWDAGDLVRDTFGTRAQQGEVGLTLSYYWDFAVLRGANYKRLKFVT